MEIESGGANGPSSRRNRSNLPGFIEFFVLFVRARVCLCVCECVCVCVCVCVASPVGLFVQKRCLETADQVQFQVPSGTSWMIRSSLAAISVVFPSIRFHSIP